MGTKDQRGARRTPAPSPTPDRSATDRRSRRSRTATIGGIALGLTAAGLAGMPAQALNGDVPTGPGNVEVFPKRDMVAIEGYAEQAGKTATITVVRNGAVVGSAVGSVDATGFLETNHPGGVCWGEGTSLKVTPDIRANDGIRVEFSDGTWDGSKVSDVEITEVVRDDAARTLTLNGRYGPGVDMPGTDLVADPGKFGVEIVNPDMRNNTSAIGERAIGWPTDEAPTGHGVSGVVTGTDETGGTFAVTYTFQTVSDLDLADAGEVVALGWLAEPDPATGVEAQYGITLNEFYEHGGPGMGGCPAGPQEIRATAPDVYSGKGAGPGSISVSWEAGTVTPDAPLITGYTVRAVDLPGVNEVGKRLDADARSTTLSGLVPGEIYSVEIAPRSSAGDGLPAVISRIAAAEHVAPAAEARTERKPVEGTSTYQPLVVENGVDYGVFLDPVTGVLGAEVHYTLDGSTPTRNSRTLPVGTSLQIEQDTRVRWLVVDSGNVVGEVAEEFFDIVEADSETQPAPVITEVATPDVSGALDVTFGRLADEAVTTYRVQAHTADGVRVGEPVDIPQVPQDQSAVTQRMTGLTDGTPYTFTVAARYGTVWSVPSAPSGPVAPARPASVDAGPDQTVLRDRSVTLDGSGSHGAAGYLWTQVPGDPALALTGADTAKPTFRFPKQTHPGDDGTYSVELTATYSDGSQRTDTVDIREQRDVVVAEEARWRAGRPLRMSGTGSQNGAVLEFRDGSATGALIGRATVDNGEWTAPSVTVNLSDGSIYVWSDYGFKGRIQTTR